MNPVESKKPTEDVLSPREVLVRPKSYKKPAKYDIQPLPQIDESSEYGEFIEEKRKNVAPSSSTQMMPGNDIDPAKDEQFFSMASSPPIAVLPTNETLSFGSLLPPISSSSPMLQMVQDLGNSPPFVPSTSLLSKSLDAIGGTLEKPITKIASTVHDGANVVSIHSTLAESLIEELDQSLLTSRFPNLGYDAQFDRYIKKHNTGMEGGSRLDVDLQSDDVYATADGVKGEKSRLGWMLGRPEAAIMKYTNLEGVTGVRPLRMKPQVQPSGLYRDVKNALGNGDDEIVPMRRLRTASEPERIGSPGADEPISSRRSDIEPVKRILRNPYANLSRKLNESPTLTFRDSRRRKAGPIYLPSCSEDEDSSPGRPSRPVNIRSPSPRTYTARSPPPTDRPYRHLSHRPIDGAPLVDSPPSQDRDSHEENNSTVGVDIASFVPPPTRIASPVVDLSSFLPPPSTTLTESPMMFPPYTLDLPQIFSSHSPIGLPPKLPPATPAAPVTNPHSGISPPHISHRRTATSNSSIYSIYTPDSSPRNSAIIPIPIPPPTFSRFTSIPSPPNTPPTAHFRSDTINTISTVPSTPTKTGGPYTHSRHDTNSTGTSSIDFVVSSPITGASPLPKSSPFPNRTPMPRSPPISTPRLHNLSQESIALTEHLVREGIYGGIVYDISVAPPLPAPHLTPKPTASQIRRRNKRAAKVVTASLRKREREEERERKAKAKGKRALTRNVKARMGKTRVSLRNRRGTLSYSKIRGVFRGWGRGVQGRWEVVRRRLFGVEFWRLVGVRPVEGNVGEEYDFVCRGVGEGVEDREWEDVRM
ncbi:hypothetical protein DSL72_008316 [Monilinia vaccinii-corymbosi]|uniref:Uncharacterized protein n=1 Tax=Monilinia vaccinii-corymbosi TaxID=61207 RepID=A0A8A3PKN0_9HELO|nr:hypothetical protein DSL72_008316 [Monilinia vaccinii-corymbosi]